MPVFPKPKFAFEYDVAAEIARLRKHRKARAIPKREAGKLLVATWNIANLGAQHRRDQDLSLIAEIVSWFDIVAVQECRENFGDLTDDYEESRDFFRGLEGFDLLWENVEGAIDGTKVLHGMPHPSPANSERIHYMLGQKPRSALSAKTDPDRLDAARAALEGKMARLLA